MAITWTKNWSGSDDGAVLRGIDLRNIQQDIDTHLGGSGVGGYVTINGTQTITGVKTFSAAVTLPTASPTLDDHASRKKYVDDAIDTDIATALNTTTGHDHDGSDSKKVVATNLDMTGITSGHYLYNNAGTLAGTASAQYFSLVEHKSVTGTTGGSMSFTGLSINKTYKLIAVGTGGFSVYVNSTSPGTIYRSVNGGAVTNSTTAQTSAAANEVTEILIRKSTNEQSGTWVTVAFGANGSTTVFQQGNSTRADFVLSSLELSFGTTYTNTWTATLYEIKTA